MKVEQKKLDKSQIELEFELSQEEFKPYLTHALEHLKSHVKVDGFRPGQVPLKMVEERVGKENVLMEAGDMAVRGTYVKYVKENILEPVGNPEISILKIADGSPFVFKAKITVLPDVELPDYKEISKKVRGNKDISVTEEEVHNSLNYLQKTRAKFTIKNDAAEKKDFVEIKYQNKEISGETEVDDKFILGEGGFMQGFEDAIVGMKAGEEKEFKAKFPETSPRKDLAGKDANFKVKMTSVQKMELPEINDEFAKQLGAFDTLIALKDSMKVGMIMEKKEGEKQRKRSEILEKIAEKSKFQMPETMVNYEKDRLLEDFKNKVTQSSKISFEEYLATTKQTEEQIKETYQKEAEKRLRGFLVLREIGRKENIEVTDKEVDEEVERSTKNYSKRPEGHPLSKIDSKQLKEYTKGVIHNEKVFKILESLS